MAGENSRYLISIAAFLAVLNFLVWRLVLAGAENQGLYFLDVGQGDGALVILESGAKVLIDGGPDAKVVSRLSEILPPFDRRLDAVVMTHAQLDHYGGLIAVLKSYRVGAFLWNGRPSDARAFRELLGAIENENAKVVVLGEGSMIKNGGSVFKVLSPSADFLKSGELNDTSLVLSLKEKNMKSLFAADIGFRVENYLIDKYDLKADVLKVPHHGSRYSSSPEFLSAVSPKAAVVSVGKNRYGHPTGETLGRLASAGARILRTDLSGTVGALPEGGEINILTVK